MFYFNYHTDSVSLNVLFWRSFCLLRTVNRHDLAMNVKCQITYSGKNCDRKNLHRHLISPFTATYRGFHHSYFWIHVTSGTTVFQCYPSRDLWATISTANTSLSGSERCLVSNQTHQLFLGLSSMTYCKSSVKVIFCLLSKLSCQYWYFLL